MPHYANGDEANVGDIVRGTTYNDQYAWAWPEKAIKATDEKVGMIMSITPGSESCNAVIAWEPQIVPVAGGGCIVSFARRDYTETRALTKIAGADGLAVA